MKYNNQLLKQAVKSSKSVIGVLRYIGACETSGGMHVHISKRIRELGLDTTHFTGLKTGFNQDKKTPSQILIKRKEGQRQKTDKIKRALLEIGREHKCAECGLDPEWNKKPLTLQIEHKNGNNLDDREDNLDFLCPNCHSQTPHYSRIRTVTKPKKCRKCRVEIYQRSKTGYCHKCLCESRSKKPKSKRITGYCKKCGKDLTNSNRIYCSYRCSHEDNSKIDWPDDLEKLVNRSSMRHAARLLGVSDRSVAKRLCKMKGG